MPIKRLDFSFLHPIIKAGRRSSLSLQLQSRRIRNQWPDLIARLNAVQTDKIWQAGSNERIGAGSVLLEEGEPVDRMYFVIEGLLHVTIGELGSHPIAVRGPGEFGCSIVLDNQFGLRSIDGMFLTRYDDARQL